ncbi:hypothetical protein RAH41_19670 [Gottfriedia acidiceleris]|uniref:hypothetical protein n=1 Tax=Gottfriedia acidiceleris TaxID=371036 RepID=UPI002F26CE58
MKSIFKKKFLSVSVLSILIGICGWYFVYQHFFSDDIFVKHNWNIGINSPTKSEIIINDTGGLGLDGQLYTVYTYDTSEFKKLTKEHFWKKIDKKNSIILKRKVNEFTKNAIEYSREKNDNQLALSRHPIIISEDGYYLITRGNKKSSDTAIFILNPTKKQLYLLEEFY